MKKFLPVYILAQRLRNIDRTILLLVILQQRNQNPRRGYCGIVQGVAILQPAVLIAEADARTAGLKIQQI
ncbi:hypothetical protein D3C73_1414950 [compost metagenome]